MPRHRRRHRSGREVGPDDHRETFVDVEDPNRVCVRVQDVFVTDTVLARTFRDDRIVAHVSKLPCRWPPVQGNLHSPNGHVHRDVARCLVTEPYRWPMADRAALD
jgi:hypothetical protein